MIIRPCSALLPALFALIPLLACAEPKVGIMIPLSGPFASMGEDSRQGVELARDEIDPEDPITVVYSDSKADPKTAVSEYRKIVETDGVIGVYALRGPVGMALNPLSKTGKVALLGGVGNKDFAVQNEFAFQLWSRSDQEGAFLAEEVTKRGAKRIALLTALDDWTATVSIGFREALPKHGGTLLIDQSFAPADTDFTTVVSQIAAKKPDALIVNLTLPQLAPFLRRAREQNFAVPIYANFWVAKKEVLAAAGTEAVEGVKFAEMDTNLPRFRDELLERFGTNASGATLAAYLATLLLGQTIKENPGITTSADLYDALLKQREIRAIDRAFVIKDRKVEFPLILKELRGGKPVASAAK